MSSTARDDIFGNLRRSLGVTGAEAPRRQVVSHRLSDAPAGVIPARGQLEGEALTDMFRLQAEAALATVAVVEKAEDVPDSIAGYLRDHNLPATLRRGDDPRLAAMPWDETTLSMSEGRSEGHDLNSVSHAFGGVAETGTLVMLSGHENPTTLNFLPDNHIVVVSEGDLAGDYESIWPRVRARFGKGVMPRTVNFITGPSRSADIEQTLFVGAHGPRRLHIVIVKGPGPQPEA